MLDTYRRTVAGALTHSMSSMKATTVAALAGAVAKTCCRHQDTNTRRAALSARSVLRLKAPLVASKNEASCSPTSASDSPPAKRVQWHVVSEFGIQWPPVRRAFCSR